MYCEAIKQDLHVQNIKLVVNLLDQICRLQTLFLCHTLDTLSGFIVSFSCSPDPAFYIYPNILAFQHVLYIYKTQYFFFILLKISPSTYLFNVIAHSYNYRIMFCSSKVHVTSSDLFYPAQVGFILNAMNTVKSR